VKNILKYVIRALPGLLFLVSATLKLLDMDSFEIYLFSFGFLSLETSFLLARILIAAEYVIGVLLIVNIDRWFSIFCGLLLTIFFSGFLIWLVIRGNNDNCHCFGEFIDLNPLQSLVKNGVLAAFLLLGAATRPFRCRRKWIIYCAAIIIPTAATFILSPPDNWYYENYGKSTTVNEDAFRSALDDGSIPSGILEGEHVVCFYSLKCEFCRMSAKKIATLRQRGEFPAYPVTVLFGKGKDPADLSEFINDTGLEPDSWQFIDPSLFLKITNGEMPLILILQDGVITKKYCYRDIR